ncbi:VCBS repeat-containing protein [Bradyrhizobium sp. RT3a]|uniref:FG-GAP repeat domain-containing protein n=1 Tax=unclassified Bradyrhizobium TaxID=2631580 RepID=UPI003393B970
MDHGWSNGAQIITEDGIGSVPDKAWHVAGVNDFNGDGTSDMLWRHDNGRLAVWTMGSAGGNQILAGNGIASSPDKSWHVADTRNYNGDGTADILWQNGNGIGFAGFQEGSSLIHGTFAPSSYSGFY